MGRLQRVLLCHRPFRNVYRIKWEVYLKKESTYQLNHGPPKWWQSNRIPFPETVTVPSCPLPGCHICAWFYFFFPKDVSDESPAQNQKMMILLASSFVYLSHNQSYSCLEIHFSEVAWPVWKNTFRNSNSSQPTSETAGVVVLRKIWIHSSVTGYKYTLCTLLCTLRGVWMGGSIGREPMRNPRHESRRLRTKEILLTPNHKKRGAEKKSARAHSNLCGLSWGSVTFVTLIGLYTKEGVLLVRAAAHTTPPTVFH